jgi:hypothetical protein
LSAEGQQFRLGHPIPVTVMMKNVSGRDIECNEPLAYKCSATETGGQHCVPITGNRFRISVRDSNGKEVAKTNYHKDLFGERGHGGSDPASNFGQSVLGRSRPRTYHADLNELFEFTQPGEYTVEVGRRELDDKNRRFVTSNPVTIHITP